MNRTSRATFIAVALAAMAACSPPSGVADSAVLGSVAGATLASEAPGPERRSGVAEFDHLDQDAERQLRLLSAENTYYEDDVDIADSHSPE